MATVLLLDDDPLALGVLTACLKRAGHEVLAASDGEQGLGMLARRGDSVDVVVTDLFMPEADGIEVVRTARATRPEIPVLVVSGGSRRGGVNFLGMAASLGAARTLPKADAPRLLPAAIAEVLAV